MRYAQVMLLTLCALALTGCGDSHDKVMGDMLSNFEQMSEVLADVKDVESAKKAVPKLEKIQSRMTALKERGDKLEEPSDEKKDALEEKYKDRYTEATEALLKEMMRITALGPEVTAELDKADMGSGSSSPGWF